MEFPVGTHNWARLSHGLDADVGRREMPVGFGARVEPFVWSRKYVLFLSYLRSDSVMPNPLFSQVSFLLLTEFEVPFELDAVSESRYISGIRADIGIGPVLLVRRGLFGLKS